MYISTYRLCDSYCFSSKGKFTLNLPIIEKNCLFRTVNNLSQEDKVLITLQSKI